MSRKKNVVISGINMVDGGIFSILLEYLEAIVEEKLYDQYHFTILVGKKELVEKYASYFEIIEFPKSKKSWISRLYYEYVYFYFFSKKREVYLWLSLHDITPNVKAEIRAVYCHNPTLGFKMKLNEIKYDKKVFLFSKLYKYLYKINIKKNDYVIVQQQCLSQLFQKTYGISNMLVARPEIWLSENTRVDVPVQKKETYQFIFAAYPRFFKNFEIICEACQLLEREEKTNFCVNLTIDGTENRYAQEIVEKYRHLKTIAFIGLIPRERLYEIYKVSDSLIFPSKLETWGLPITEFEMLDKPMIVIDLPYAHETVGDYEKVCFFEAGNIKHLAQLMKTYIEGRTEFEGNPDYVDNYDCKSWKELNDIILKENEDG